MEIEYQLKKLNSVDELSKNLNYKCEARNKNTEIVLHIVNYAVTRLFKCVEGAKQGIGGQALVITYIIYGSDNDLKSLSVINKNLPSIAQDPNILLADKSILESISSSEQGKVFKKQKKRNISITEEKLDEMISKPTKLCLRENNNLRVQVEKKNVKKISEKESIFRSLSFKLGIVLKILQKLNHLT